MTLSRSPSPVPGSTWSSPGLNSNHSGRSTPSQPAASPLPWEASKMRGLGITSYPSEPAQSQGFFRRHMRGLSSSLPRFAPTRHAAMIEKEEALNRRYRAKFGGTLSSRLRRVSTRMGSKLRQRLLLGLILWLLLHYFYSRKLTRLSRLMHDG
jgi:mannan polymerase II complex MNN10 subunit